MAGSIASRACNETRRVCHESCNKTVPRTAAAPSGQTRGGELVDERAELVADHAGAADLEAAPRALRARVGLEVADDLAAAGDRQRQAGAEAERAQRGGGGRVGLGIVGQQLRGAPHAGAREPDLVGLQLGGQRGEAGVELLARGHRCQAGARAARGGGRSRGRRPAKRPTASPGRSAGTPRSPPAPPAPTARTGARCRSPGRRRRRGRRAARARPASRRPRRTRRRRCRARSARRS